MSVDARLKFNQGEFDVDAELQIPPTGITALFGPSGSGKTSILRALAGLDRHAGNALRSGEQIWQSESVFVPPHQRRIGYVFQEASLFAHMNVEDNLRYGLKRVPQQAGEDAVIPLGEIIELLELDALLTRSTDKLSGGERQRVAIARALAAQPRLLLMDEPLASLDQRRRNEILPFIESLHRTLAIPVVYVSHSADEVARIADHLILLQHGRVTAAGPINEMLTRLDLPIAHGDDAEAVIEARVIRHDEQYDLTHLGFAGGEFVVPRKNLPHGEQVRLRIAARDVSLTLQPQTGTSILNIFPATIAAMIDEQPSQVLLRLNVQGELLLARLTRKSVDQLGLQVGGQVFAQAKAAAVLS